jgi:hypothetical protein
LWSSDSSLYRQLFRVQIAFAVGKAPMAKILDVFGRAEGISIAAAFYTLGGYLW